jgi:hypothetical protein
MMLIPGGLGHPNSTASCAPAWARAVVGRLPTQVRRRARAQLQAARSGRREPRPARSIRLGGRRSRLRPPRQKVATRLRARPRRVVGASGGATVRPRPGRAIVARSPRFRRRRELDVLGSHEPGLRLRPPSKGRYRLAPLETVEDATYEGVDMCLTCGCMDAHQEMGQHNFTYEDLKAAADENGKSVAETLEIVNRTAAKDKESHAQEYAPTT